MSTVILELDTEQLHTGYLTAIKKDEKGRRKGKMPLSAVADLLHEIFDWEAARRPVRMFNRFEESPYIALGQNGTKWEAVKEIAPAEYYLVSATGMAYQVTLPRLIVRVGNHITWPKIFWTGAEPLSLSTKIYPLVIGNTYNDGRVCTGTTGLKCTNPEDIDRYIRQIIESPASHTVTGNTDKLYRALATGWAPGIGRKNGITLKRLISGNGGE